MKKFKRVLALICSGVMLFSLAACGGGEQYDKEVIDDSSDTLSGTVNIRLLETGYGTAWLDGVAAAFNRKYPDVKIKINGSV
ncbi:MAG: hypothetical protein IJQ66_01100, partial [Clostridia bacterium]|nr:hypothetical protein [Clostridia bacterium]